MSSQLHHFETLFTGIRIDSRNMFVWTLTFWGTAFGDGKFLRMEDLSSNKSSSQDEEKAVTKAGSRHSGIGPEPAPSRSRTAPKENTRSRNMSLMIIRSS